MPSNIIDINGGRHEGGTFRVTDANMPFVEAACRMAEMDIGAYPTRDFLQALKQFLANSQQNSEEMHPCWPRAIIRLGDAADHLEAMLYRNETTNTITSTP